MQLVPRIVLFQRPVDDRKRLTPQFEQLWRIYTFFLVLLGFLALAFTGELGPVVVVMFLAGWFLGLVQPRFFMRLWRPWMKYLLFWSCLIAIAVQFRFTAILQLLLFLGLFKCLTLREPLDHLHAMLMAFFMLIACTVITSSITYLVFMAVFVILVMLDLACYTLAQEAGNVLMRQKGFSSARLFTGTIGEHALFRRLLWGNAIFAVFILILAHIFFFLMPHYPTHGNYNPFMRPAPPEPEAVSGFSEGMDLSPVDRITLDDRQVMSVNVSWEENHSAPLPGYLRLRGAIFNLLHEGGWATAMLTQNIGSDSWSTVSLPLEVAAEGPRLYQQVSQNAGSIKRLFAAGYPETYIIDRLRVSLNYDARSLAVSPGYFGSISYGVRSAITDDGMVQFRKMARAMTDLGIESTPGDSLELARSLNRNDTSLPSPDPGLVMLPDQREINTSLPAIDLSGKVRKLAAQHGAGRNVPEIADSLFSWLQSDFTYSLTPDTPENMNPLEAFLLHTKKGHCEYFASALVVLLRARDIPARVVTGFYTTERDGNSGKFTVRQSDAHAWTEIWFDGFGWLTVDPTPPTLRGRASFDTFKPPFWKTLGDSVRAFWQNNILDYSNTETARSMARVFSRSFEENIRAFGDWAGSYLSRQFGDDSEARSGKFDWKSRQFWETVRPLSGIVFLLLLWVLYRASRRGKPARDDRESPVGFMNQLLRRLETLGWKRGPGQTPAELLRHIDAQTQGRWELENLIDFYHRCRFANIPPTHEELQKIHRTLREIH